MSRQSNFLIAGIIAVGMLTTSARAALVAYWPFDEGQGTAAVDATGNGNDGTLSNGVEWVAGVKGTAIRLDTAGERVVTTPLDPTAANNAMTLAAWVVWEGNGHSVTHQGIIGKRQGWDPRTYVKWFWEATPAGQLAFRNGDTAVNAAGALIPYENEWAHVAVTWDAGAVVHYVNAEEVATGNITFRATADETIVSVGSVSATNSETWIGILDEARIYDTALSTGELQKAMSGDYTSSSGPVPADGMTDVPQDVILSFLPGEYAVAHDIYLGTDFADVEAASRSNPMGVLVSQGQSAVSYDPPALLDFEQIYYWRVDEVNGAPDNTIFKGQVWSFTVEPYVYPLTNIQATASLADVDSPAANTVNGSGLNADGQHSVEATDMWLASPTEEMPIWIQYEFDRIYQLHGMRVWNYNSQFEVILGFGLKDVTIEHSVDGIEWTVFGDVELAKGTALPDYVANTTIDLSGVAAKYVRLTMKSNWNMGMIPQYGLSEVQFTYLPVQAREPQPTSGQAGTALDVTLDWRNGRQASAHELYVSTDRAAVADGAALVDTLTESRYELTDLNLGSIYYWKVNEVNEIGPSLWEGDIWSFSTIEYAMVEDFETYTDDMDAGSTIFQTWLDGWTNETGSIVGYFDAPFAERSIVNTGRQSMPLEYNNTDAPFYSEAERTFDSPQDWAANGADTLVVYFQGQPGPFAELASGTIVMGAAGTDIWNTTDEFRFAYKSLSGDGSIVARVESVANTDPWAKAGVMIRETLEAGSTFAAVYATPGNGCRYQARLATDASAVSDSDVATSAQTGLDAPHWVKIERVGTTFNGYFSSDGENWTAMAWNPQTIAMGANVYVGLALSSHSAGVLGSAEFSDVATTGNVTGSWAVETIGVEQPEGNAADTLYVAIEDASGKVATVTHPAGEAATLLAGWNEWRIPFSDLSGVNLSRVDTMYIGIGDRTNPTAGGAGMIFVDTIRVGHPGSVDPGASGLVASYSLEEGVLDDSGNGHDGTAMGEPTVVDGPEGLGMALLFDGLGEQYVHLGTWNPSADTGQLSVCLWAQWNGLSGSYQGLAAKRDSWATDDMMWQIEANRDSGAVSFARNGSSPASGGRVLPIGEWTHVATTFDGTTARFYINAERTGEGAFSFGSDTEAAVVFGACEGDGGNPFNGAIDEVKIYDRPLSPFELNFLAGK